MGKDLRRIMAGLPGKQRLWIVSCEAQAIKLHIQDKLKMQTIDASGPRTIRHIQCLGAPCL